MYTGHNALRSGDTKPIEIKPLVFRSSKSRRGDWHGKTYQLPALPPQHQISMCLWKLFPVPYTSICSCPRPQGITPAYLTMFLGQVWCLWFPFFLMAATSSDWWLRWILFLFQFDIQISLSELSSSVICSIWFSLASTWVPRSPSWELCHEPHCWGELRHDVYNLHTDRWNCRVGQGWGGVKEMVVSSVPASSVNSIPSKSSKYLLST